MTIYLVRHGQKQSAVGDPGLTEVGIRQAQQTGQYLKQFPINKIITSPFKRTVETAFQISQALDLDYSPHIGLVERMNWNDTSISRNEFFREWIKATNDREYVPLYGNSSRQTGKRVEQLVQSLNEPTSHVVLVTHGGAILDYLRNLFGDEQVSLLKTHYSEGDDFQMFHCAINTVVLEDKPALGLLNYIEHLTDVNE